MKKIALLCIVAILILCSCSQQEQIDNKNKEQDKSNEIDENYETPQNEKLDEAVIPIEESSTISNFHTPVQLSYSEKVDRLYEIWS